MTTRSFTLLFQPNPSTVTRVGPTRILDSNSGNIYCIKTLPQSQPQPRQDEFDVTFGVVSLISD